MACAEGVEMTNVLLARPAPGVALVTLNRPEKYNAINLALIEDLGAVFAEIGGDQSLRAVVLTGAGKGFCAGVDLVALGEGIEFPADTIGAINSCPLPVIGAINGAAVTGGLEIALACDFRIASDRAKFADTHSRVGVVPAWRLTARLPQAVGQSWARQMSFTGDYVDAELALRIGLVNEVVAHDHLLDRCLAIASAIAETSRATLTKVRELYGLTRDGVGQQAVEEEQRIAAHGLAMDDPEGFAARREAVFTRGRTQ